MKKILRTANQGPILLVFIKENAPQQEQGNHYSVIKGVLCRSGDTTCFFRVRVFLFTK